MDVLKDFPTDFSKAYVIPFIYFNRCNVGFFQGRPSCLKYSCIAIMTMVVTCNLASWWLYIFRAFGGMEISELAFMVSASVVGLQGFLKATVLLPEKKDMEILIRGLGKMWKTENLNDIQIKVKNRRLKQLKIGQLGKMKLIRPMFYLTKSIYWGTPLAIIQNLAPQLIKTVIGKISREDSDFILPLGYMYPFDPVENWGRYLLVYFIQCYSFRLIRAVVFFIFFQVLMLIYFYLGATCLILTLLSQLSMEFVILREDIKHAIPVMKRDRIAVCLHVDESMSIEAMIKNHQELLKLAQLLNKIFNRMVFFDLCCYAVIVSFFAVILVVTRDPIDKLRCIVSISCMLIMIYLFCYFCEDLKRESTGIAESAYENPWYEGATQYQKTMTFIIMRSQSPCYLTSLNYAPIDLTTFTAVISTTWSYFSLAMTMYE